MLSSVRPLAAVLVLGLAFLPAPAAAQSILEKLFSGFGAPSEPPAAKSPGGGRAGRPVGSADAPVGPAINLRSLQSDRYTPRPQREAEPEDDGRKVKTVCVRPCDGYYWPVSASVPFSHVERDTGVCRRSCGQPTRLFTLPTRGEIKDAEDLAGRSYALLPNAFKYRKALVQGCSCHEPPWSESEIERHRQYAEAEAAVERERRLKAEMIAEARSSETARERLAGPEAVAEVEIPPRAIVVARANGTSERVAGPVTVAEIDVPAVRPRGSQETVALLSEGPPVVEVPATPPAKTATAKVASTKPARPAKAGGPGPVPSKTAEAQRKARSKPAAPTRLATKATPSFALPFSLGGPSKFRYPGD